jgi:hypothetical protein
MNYIITLIDKGYALAGTSGAPPYLTSLDEAKEFAHRQEGDMIFWDCYLTPDDRLLHVGYPSGTIGLENRHYEIAEF